MISYMISIDLKCIGMKYRYNQRGIGGGIIKVVDGNIKIWKRYIT